MTVEVKVIAAKAVDVLSPVRTESGDGIGFQWIAFDREFLQNATDLNDVVENQAVGDQVVITN